MFASVTVELEGFLLSALVCGLLQGFRLGPFIINLLLLRGTPKFDEARSAV